jgi:excisionase family DNA binding protein
MKNTPGKTILNQEEEAAVQAIAEKMGRQISQVMTDSLREALSLMRENRSQSALQPSNHQLDEFLTAGDVARILKVSKAQVYRLIKIREIPSFSIGRTVRVRRMDLDAVIQAHLVRVSLF